MDNLPYSNKLILVNRPYKNLKSQCVIPGQEHLPELAIMSDPLNTFDIMAWLKKVAMLFKCKLLRCSI
ncbi:acetyl transferase domain protein [Streptococcus pneumoniae GA13224]|nr:acetyl transferase domain protein [Streptococcus pneumoniae GA13224]